MKTLLSILLNFLLLTSCKNKEPIEVKQIKLRKSMDHYEYRSSLYYVLL
jgi:hypothetical protein